MRNINENKDTNSLSFGEGRGEARVAITTSNGEKVDQHFGKATSFSIYEMDANELKLIETREVESYCEQKNGEPIDPNHKFSDDRFSKVYEMIKDCSVLYTQQIGNKPGEVLNTKGIKVQSCSCNIQQIPTCKGNCK